MNRPHRAFRVYNRPAVPGPTWMLKIILGYFELGRKGSGPATAVMSLRRTLLARAHKTSIASLFNLQQPSDFRLHAPAFSLQA